MNEIAERPGNFADPFPITNGPKEKMAALLDADPREVLWCLLIETARWALKRRKKLGHFGNSGTPISPTMAAAYEAVITDAYKAMRFTDAGPAAAAFFTEALASIVENRDSATSVKNRASAISFENMDDEMPF